MKFCSKCGTQLDDNTQFCNNCGTPVAAPGYQQPQQQQAYAQQQPQQKKSFLNTPDTTSEFDPEDIALNNRLSFLSYIGALVLVPIFCVKKSKFARYHANQGLILFIVEFAYGVIQMILDLILKAIFPLHYSLTLSLVRNPAYYIISVLLSLAWVALIFLNVTGIINAVKGKAKELPIIGKFKILK